MKPSPTVVTLPTHTPDALVVPTKLAAALMQFATKDVTRYHMTGLGLDDCHLCASDGHTAARAMGCDPNGQVPKERDGSSWSRTVVEAAIKAAKRDKSPVIALLWSERTPRETGSTDFAIYPPVRQVVAVTRTVRADTGVGLNPRYVARLEAVAAAVQGDRVETRDMYQCALVHTPPSNGACEPFLWEVPGTKGRPRVEVAIMPTRL